MPWYSADLEIDVPNPTNATASDLLDKLIDHHTVISARQSGRTGVLMSIEADTITDAAARGIELVRLAARREPIAATVMTEHEFYTRNDLTPAE